MTAIIISIGDELLVGQVVNTNASWLGDQLTRVGCRVLRINAIGDERGLIRSEIEHAAAAADFVFVSGGLGPTHDDVTRDAICDLLGCDLEMDADQLRRIEMRFADRGIDLNERSRRQALVPADCRRLPNDYGSAPGLGFSIGAARVFALPGVPSEMKGIFTDRIFPEISAGAGDIDQTTFLAFGVTESALADALSETIPLLDGSVTLAYLPAVGGIRLRAMRLTAGEDQHARYGKLLEIIREKAAQWIIADRDETLVAVTGRMLKERGLMLATAESCTGGMIGELITEIPGSSAYYLGGTVSYANSVKTELLGVPAELIEQHGAVSREVAEAMAAGVRQRLGADIAVSVTGIAGPDGGTPEKPVGTVWIGISSERGTRAEQFTLGKERGYIRQRASQQAIDIVRREISGGNLFG
ncbi:MAG: competence/damage-inducible protein A [Candidatus Kapaibacterium sp.]